MASSGGISRWLRSFWRLYASEVAGGFSTAALFATGIVTLDVLLRVLPGVYDRAPSPAFARIPIVVLPIWAMAAAFRSLHVEWRDDTVVSPRSLPVGPHAVAGAKLLAVMTYFTALSAVAGVGDAMVRQGPTAAAIASVETGGYGAYWVAASILAVVGQVAFLSGRCVAWWRTPTYIGSFLAQLWFLFRLGGLIRPAFEWVPDHTLRTMDGMASIFDTSPVAAVAACGFVLFVLGGLILGRALEQRGGAGAPGRRIVVAVIAVVFAAAIADVAVNGATGVMEPLLDDMFDLVPAG